MFEQQKLHVKQRADERYGLSLNRSDLRALSAKIAEGGHDVVWLEARKPDLTKRHEGGVVYAVYHLDQWLVVFYNTRLKMVTTMWPRYYLAKFREKIFGHR